MEKTLNTAQKECYGSYLSIVLSVKTRWFSTLRLVERILLLKNEINGIIEAMATFEIKFKFRLNYIPMTTNSTHSYNSDNQLTNVNTDVKENEK